MPPQIIKDAVRNYMPNFNRWVEHCGLPESELMDEIEKIVGMWLRKPIGQAYTAKESLIYTSTLATLIKDRGSVQDELMFDTRAGGLRLLGPRENDKVSHGVIDWDAQETYAETNAVTKSYVDNSIEFMGVGKVPEDAITGMTYFDAKKGMMYTYDGTNWLQVTV